jgi:hypothetical protein
LSLGFRVLGFRLNYCNILDSLDEEMLKSNFQSECLD